MSMSRVREVEIKTQNPQAYRQFHEEEFRRLQAAARGLAGKRILHVNSTSEGGGVAELLSGQVPLERGLGLRSRWLVLQPGEPAFFEVTKKIHNLFQGQSGELTESEQAVYQHEGLQLQEALATTVREQMPDIIVAHDPQPLLAVAGVGGEMKKILRLHIDICEPNPWVVAWLCEKIGRYNHVIVSRQDCAPTCLPFAATSAIAPAIDPLATKNQPMAYAEARAVLARYGIDTKRPMVAQVSRFDPWKDPVGVIEAYRLAKQTMGDLQLVLVGFIQAADDPEATRFVERARAAAGDDGDIVIFSDLQQLQGVTNEEFVRAVQAGSDVILQKSTREGFGLTVTEAMWKGKAVVGGRAGGIRLQIQNGETGRLVTTVQETAQALVQLLQSRELRERLGAAARESVREKFLLPRFVRENVEVYSTVLV